MTLGDDDKIVEIYSKEVYTILESFKILEVIIEIKYKTINKKIKPVIRSLSKNFIE